MLIVIKIILMESGPKNQLIQQKIKQRLQQRKRISSKGTPTTIKRLKSNFEAEGNTEDIELKPMSSNSQRPISARRLKNTGHSYTTDSSNKTDIDVTGLINDVFDKSFDLGKYLNRKDLNPEECKNKLLQNSLFHTLLISRLSRTNEDEYESIVGRQIISKLQKMSLMVKQEQNCQRIENKISQLLQKRLKSLSSY